MFISDIKYRILNEYIKSVIFNSKVINNNLNTSIIWINNDYEWVFVQKTNEDILYYNNKYFCDFLFKIFDINIFKTEEKELIRKLLKDSYTILMNKYYVNFYEGYLDKVLNDFYISDKYTILSFSLERLRQDENYNVIIGVEKLND